MRKILIVLPVIHGGFKVCQEYYFIETKINGQLFILEKICVKDCCGHYVVDITCLHALRGINTGCIKKN